MGDIAKQVFIELMSRAENLGSVSEKHHEEFFEGVAKMAFKAEMSYNKVSKEVHNIQYYTHVDKLEEEYAKFFEGVFNEDF